MSEIKAVDYKVVNQQGKEVGTVKLNSAIFSAPINETLVHETVVWQLAKRRAGTHSAQTKAEVSGGGKKPWKQKGTGQARAGSNTSPLWVGGGVAHGPKPRDYTTRLPKRSRLQALCAVLSDKAAKQEILVVDDLNIKSGKTKDMITVFSKLGISGQKVALLVNAEQSTGAVARSSRNIPGVRLMTSEGVNVYDMMKYKYLLTTKEGIEALELRIKKSELVVNGEQELLLTVNY